MANGEMSDIERATQIYGEMAANPYIPTVSSPNNLTVGGQYDQGTYWGTNPVPGTPYQIGGGPGQARFNPAMKAGAGYTPTVRSSGGGGGGATSTAPTRGVYTPVKFNAPEKISLPKYTPPEYQKGEERKFREEYAAPGMAQIRRTSQQAIISSKSLDNPNARALFIQNALSGVGQAVEKVTAGASVQARAEAQQNYANELAKYNTQWKALGEESKLNWDAEWKAALANFEEQAWGAHTQYQYGSGSGGTTIGEQPGMTPREKQQASLAAHPSWTRI